MTSTNNAAAPLSIAHDTKLRTARRYTTFENGWTVETWWDGSKDVHSWVTQVKDQNGMMRDHDTCEHGGESYVYAGSDGGKNVWARQNHDCAIAAVIAYHAKQDACSHDNWDEYFERCADCGAEKRDAK